MDVNKDIEIKSVFVADGNYEIEIDSSEELTESDLLYLFSEYVKLFNVEKNQLIIKYKNRVITLGDELVESVQRLNEDSELLVDEQTDVVVEDIVVIDNGAVSSGVDDDGEKKVNDSSFDINGVDDAHQEALEVFGDIEIKEIESAEEEANESADSVISLRLSKLKKSAMKKPVKKKKKREVTVDDRVIYKALVKGESRSIDEVGDENQIVVYEGFVFGYSSIVTKTGKTIVSFYLTDKRRAIKCKIFLSEKDLKKYTGISDKMYIKVKGMVKFDTFDKENVLSVSSVSKSEYVEKQIDTYPEKRVELHMHTNMTAMSGIPSLRKIAARAKKNGYKAIAITDNSVIQAYPSVGEARQKENLPDDFKFIYGLEANVINYDEKIVDIEIDRDLDSSFVVFDLETTGFSPVNDRIIEVGAVKIVNKKIVDTFSSFVYPEMPIPKSSTDVCGITDDMVKDAPLIDAVLPEFIDFCGDSVLVAHNAAFDRSFIVQNSKRLGIDFSPSYLDTLTLSRILLTNISRHGLKYVSRELGVSLINHHRAYQDAEATGNVLIKLFQILIDYDVTTLHQLNDYSADKRPIRDFKHDEMTILVEKQEALFGFYKLISNSHMETFHKVAHIKRSELEAAREGLLIGSGGVNGELFKAAMNKKSREELIQIASFYDYLEIQPSASARLLYKENMIQSVSDYRDIVKQIVSIGEELGIPVVATSNAYFLDQEDKVLRDIILNSTVPFIRLKESEDLYLRTTEEMLEEFSYLGREKAREVVIVNTNSISDKIGDIKPIPSGTYPPFIEGADEDFKKICYKRVHEIYGEDLPEIISSRLDREVKSIVEHGFAVMYLIARNLVKKSEEDGYLVGSRGSVGSSFAATMAGITEVNPLPAHYYCDNPDCHYVTFDVPDYVLDGFDLPEKDCPNCSNRLIREGHNIPFETFLGFNGDKEPDIDLNFASVYQSNAHEFTKVLFGEGYTFKAGTISTVAGKKAYGHVKKYFERIGEDVSNGFASYLASNLEGVKVTTGQHPGGIMVVPKTKDIHDFTPVQFPANDASKGVITTHFDYHSISGRILKLDLLGHESPTTLKFLEEATGFDPLTVNFDDKKTMEVFRSTDSLDIVDNSYTETSGSLGIPEFGTKFVREMLKDTRPVTFIELIKIAGLAHGTDVWLNNAQELVRNNTCTLMEAICTRDEIMTYLIRMGVESKMAFTIMEKVRKGKGLTEEFEKTMRDNNVPEWYIDSCKKIKYMFPAAHSAAYVMMSFRIAYFKVYYPLAFYSTYFSSNISDFDADIIIKGSSHISAEINAYKSAGKVDNKLYVFELAMELIARGYSFANVDINKSGASQFVIEGNKLRIPFRALKGFGEKAAESLVKERETMSIYSVEDLKKVSGVNKSSIEALEALGALDGMPKTNQFSLDMFLN